MTLFAQLKARLPNIALLKPGRAQQILADEIRKEMGSVVIDLDREVKQQTPVDRGILRASILGEVIDGPGRTVQGIVSSGTQAPYAPHVEFGTKPHFPPVDPLKGWAKRVLGDEQAAWAIARTIARRGTKGRFMFKKARDTIFPTVPRRFRQAIQRARERLIGRP